MTGRRVCEDSRMEDSQTEDREQRDILTKFIWGASKPDIVKNMLSDIEQRDSFFWSELLIGT